MGRVFVLLQCLLPKHLLSRVAGRLARSDNALVKSALINIFCRRYKVDLSEAERSNKSDYRSFNDFFTRRLKPGARPISGRIASPADGTVASLGLVSDGTIIQAKGVGYSLAKLLGEEDCTRFEGGSYITIYLAPHNYHRFHVPCASDLHQAHYIPGELFSVNAATAEYRQNLFAKNERLVAQFTSQQGDYAYIMVGALLVAGIKPVWQDQPCEPAKPAKTQIHRPFAQGEELGQFQLGSTVILVFNQPQAFTVNEGDKIQMGQALVG